jgi:hypothetical protein
VPQHTIIPPRCEQRSDAYQSPSQLKARNGSRKLEPAIGGAVMTRPWGVHWVRFSTPPADTAMSTPAWERQKEEWHGAVCTRHKGAIHHALSLTWLPSG